MVRDTRRVWTGTIRIKKGTPLRDLVGGKWLEAPANLVIQEAYCIPNLKARTKRLKGVELVDWWWFYRKFSVKGVQGPERFLSVRAKDVEMRGTIRRPKTVKEGAPFDRGREMLLEKFGEGTSYDRPRQETGARQEPGGSDPPDQETAADDLRSGGDSVGGSGRGGTDPGASGEAPAVDV